MQSAYDIGNRLEPLGGHNGMHIVPLTHNVRLIDG